jgi:hypothetical protein
MTLDMARTVAERTGDGNPQSRSRQGNRANGKPVSVALHVAEY